MKKCSECNNWGCTLRNYVTDECTINKYETIVTNSTASIKPKLTKEYETEKVE